MTLEFNTFLLLAACAPAPSISYNCPTAVCQHKCIPPTLTSLFHTCNIYKFFTILITHNSTVVMKLGVYAESVCCSLIHNIFQKGCSLFQHYSIQLFYYTKIYVQPFQKFPNCFSLANDNLLEVWIFRNSLL